ncbi:MAG: hypothetical protein ACRDPB_10350 [Nocardioidaceae bacterium]
MSETTPFPNDTAGVNDTAGANDRVDPDDVAGPTPVPAVDDVVAGLDALDQLPVDEHVAILESAHERLRSALSDVGEADA